jgi:hypothetical protein
MRVIPSLIACDALVAAIPFLRNAAYAQGAADH